MRQFQAELKNSFYQIERGIRLMSEDLKMEIFIDFLKKMILKYGKEVLEEIEKEKSVQADEKEGE